MSENTVHKGADGNLAELVKKQQDEIADLKTSLKKEREAMLRRLKDLEHKDSVDPLIAFDDFDEAIAKSRKAIYTPARITSLSSPVRMTVRYRPTEDLVDKVLTELDEQFEFKNGRKDPVTYESLVNDMVVKHGLASEMREVTRKMNLLKASPLRKAIYAKGYAWALEGLFTDHKNDIKTMVEDAYGFSQKVTAYMETRSDGPIEFFTHKAVEHTMERNSLCGNRELEKQIALSLREKL